MGKNLDIQKSGLHVAFAAGTGVLPFMDLVGLIALKNLGLSQYLGEADNIEAGFKLKLFVSFQSRADSIGLDLCENLHSFCKTKGIDNFELFVRLSNENLNVARWD